MYPNGNHARGNHARGADHHRLERAIFIVGFREGIRGHRAKVFLRIFILKGRLQQVSGRGARISRRQFLNAATLTRPGTPHIRAAGHDPPTGRDLLEGRSITVNAVAKPDVRPANPCFSSGPCSKPPGWSPGRLDGAFVGRSHRHKDGKARINEVISRTRAVLKIPKSHLIGIVPGSETGAMEMALWSLLGARGVDVLNWEQFGAAWAGDGYAQLHQWACTHHTDPTTGLWHSTADRRGRPTTDRQADRNYVGSTCTCMYM